MPDVVESPIQTGERGSNDETRHRLQAGHSQVVNKPGKEGHRKTVGGIDGNIVVSLHRADETQVLEEPVHAPVIRPEAVIDAQRGKQAQPSQKEGKPEIFENPVSVQGHRIQPSQN